MIPSLDTHWIIREGLNCTEGRELPRAWDRTGLGCSLGINLCKSSPWVLWICRYPAFVKGQKTVLFQTPVWADCARLRPSFTRRFTSCGTFTAFPAFTQWNGDNGGSQSHVVAPWHATQFLSTLLPPAPPRPAGSDFSCNRERQTASPINDRCHRIAFLWLKSRSLPFGNTDRVGTRLPSGGHPGLSTASLKNTNPTFSHQWQARHRLKYYCGGRAL